MCIYGIGRNSHEILLFLSSHTHDFLVLVMVLNVDIITNLLYFQFHMIIKIY
jgi:hypothetical protein